MRVLITLPVKVGFDGMTKQVLSYSQYMDKSDMEIDLLSCRGFDSKMKNIVEEAGFANIYRLEYRDTNQIKYFVDLCKIIHREHYDVIHANGQSATMSLEMLAGKINGCKVRIAHSHSSKCLHLKAHRLLNPLFQRLYTDAIACSKEAGEWLFQGKFYRLLNNGIETDKFSFSQEERKKRREELQINDREVAVGSVAAFEPWKNHGFMIEIFEKLIVKDPSYKLYMWGIDGTTKENIIGLIQQKNLSKNVFYMGVTDHIEHYLQAMDVMLLPSWYEGFPVTAVEWQAAGLPCLISDSITRDVALTDLVKFLPTDNVNEWVDSLVDSTTDCSKRHLYSQTVKDKGFDIESNVAVLKGFYIEALQRGK